MLCYVMLCYVMLCYVMLCYVMLCYVMLCYVEWLQVPYSENNVMYKYGCGWNNRCNLQSPGQSMQINNSIELKRDVA